jgi:hypothetical protein
LQTGDLQMTILTDLETTFALPSELDFQPVREQQMRNGVTIDNAFWTINPLTDEVIGSGKSKHRPENFATMWNRLVEGLHSSDLDLSNAQVNFNNINNGAAFRADIVLPKHDYKHVVGEETSMKLRIYDSHDQSFKRQVDAMILRLACLNGMETISRDIGIAQRHTVMADAEKMGEVASGFPLALEKEAHIHKHLQEVPLAREMAIRFMADNVAVRKTRIGMEVNKKQLDELVYLWDSYHVGNNVYRLYNVLTHMSTHVEAKRDGANVSRKQLMLEEKVRGVLRSPEFYNLAQLAA